MEPGLYQWSGATAARAPPGGIAPDPKGAALWELATCSATPGASEQNHTVEATVAKPPRAATLQTARARDEWGGGPEPGSERGASRANVSAPMPGA
jgi:hypothetical protein